MTVIKYFLSMLLVLICVVMQAQNGIWNGELSIQGIKLPIVFHFNPNGCTMDSPSQGANDVPMSLKPVFAKSIIPFDENYLRYFITVDASQLLSKITCPVLALNGTKDIQVDCQTNISVLQKGLTHCKHTVKALEGLNHLF